MRVIFTSYFLKYSKVHYYTQLHKTLLDHGGSNDSYLQENQEWYTTCTLSMTCQIDVVNKQLVPPLN